MNKRIWFQNTLKEASKICFLVISFLMYHNAINAQNSTIEKDETNLIINADFETGNLNGWKHWKTRGAYISTEAFSGKYAVKIGPERAFCIQETKIKSNSLYRISAYLKTESGAEELQLMVSDFGGVAKSVSSAKTEYTKVSIEFQTAFSTEKLVISLSHLSGNGHGFADQIELKYLGEAPKPTIQEFVKIPKRIIKEENGVAQLSNEKMEWFLNDKFGMFIHWGVYAAMDEGAEWVRHQEAWGHEYYQRRARNPETGFTAAKFDASKWTELAKKAGMKYMALTTRHHDGYALFDSKHPSSWTSQKDLGRDFIKEYVDAARASGLHLGMYYSPMSWRYPGYYDVTGKDAKPNVWGYKTAAWHKDDARDMKEEVYEQVTTILKNYGKIDYMFWDGGWLGQSFNPELERTFWDSGRYQNPRNEWPVNEKYTTKDDNGKALGIMGLVRKYQPDIVLANALEDRHPDHGKGAQLAIDACFLSGLRQIKTGDLPAWRPAQVYHYIQDRYLEPDFVVDISSQWDQKEAAIRAFKSQFFDPNSAEPASYISSPDFLNFIQARAMEMGHKIGVKYGEGFQSQKTLEKTLLD